MKLEHLEIKADVLALEDGINALKIALEALEPFDGKVINVKLETALKAAVAARGINGFYSFHPTRFSRSPGHYELRYHTNVTVTDPNQSGPVAVAYYPQKYRDITVGIQMLSRPTGHDRYDHTAATNAVARHCASLEQTLAETRKALDPSTLAALEQRHQALLAEIDAFNKALPAMVRNYLQINTRTNC